MNELPVIQKTYDFIKWYVPISVKFPKTHKFGIGDRITNLLYQILEDMIMAKYAKNKIPLLENINAKLDVLRYHSRLLFDLKLIDHDRYQYISTQFHGIGIELGGWLKQQKSKNQVNHIEL
jgi:hypothetical protein